MLWTRSPRPEPLTLPDRTRADVYPAAMTGHSFNDLAELSSEDGSVSKAECKVSTLVDMNPAIARSSSDCTSHTRSPRGGSTRQRLRGSCGPSCPRMAPCERGGQVGARTYVDGTTGSEFLSEVDQPAQRRTLRPFAV